MAVGITLKLSFGALAVFGGLLLGSLALRARGDPAGPRWSTRTLATGATLIVLTLGVWAWRNFLSSGYPAYPVPWPGGQPMWSIPRERVEEDASWIASWARKPRERPEVVLATWDWLGPWLGGIPAIENRRFDVLYPLLAFCLGGGLWILLGRRSEWRGGLATAFLLPGIGSALVWFLTAPDPRLAGAGLWWMGAGALTGGLSGFLRTRPIAGKILAIGIAASILFTHWDEEKLINPGPLRGFHLFPRVELASFRTDSGLVLSVPQQRGACWDSGLLCTPDPNADLALIRPDDLAGGFFVER
jgi:hypothetical protein